MTAPAPTAATVALRPLACPYCAGRITAELIYTAHYSEHRDLDSYSCDDCGAEWERDGKPKCGPHEHYWRGGKAEDAVPPWLATPDDQDDDRIRVGVTAILKHEGYLDEDATDFPEITDHRAHGCEWESDHWLCVDEDEKPRHPVEDHGSELAEILMVALEAIDGDPR